MAPQLRLVQVVLQRIAINSLLYAATRLCFMATASRRAPETRWAWEARCVSQTAAVSCPCCELMPLACGRC